MKYSEGIFQMTQKLYPNDDVLLDLCRCGSKQFCDALSKKIKNEISYTFILDAQRKNMTETQVVDWFSNLIKNDSFNKNENNEPFGVSMKNVMSSVEKYGYTKDALNLLAKKAIKSKIAYDTLVNSMIEYNQQDKAEVKVV